MVMSMKEARNLALKAEVVMKERIYHDPYQKYGGDDNNGDFEKVKEVAQSESSSSIASMERVSLSMPRKIQNCSNQFVQANFIDTIQEEDMV
ncbi:hypothetical protein GH714_005526 [Hevea brasiliensis]|uniref:Uncharacterized protein n=1 Tax=Hevea brasiliensis TaxID=3981 RepID=A0A6A6LEN8_HEVBR|nr:hypothetical protein GH714_005526 [Hevea brasiliensis]